jgi:hypothetical protein
VGVWSGCAAVAIAAGGAWASTFGSAVVSYSPGSNPVPGFTNASAAIGTPERYTGEGIYPSAVTPFNPAFGTDEIVSLGAGGSIVLELGTPATDDAANPYGIDLLIFGNQGLVDGAYPLGIATGTFSTSSGGRVEVSADGLAWTLVPGVEPAGGFSTLGYLDLADPYATVAGTVLSDFSRPVNPAFNPIGRTYAEIVSAYAGSGGGTGIDLASAGVTSARFVRISNFGTSAFQVDAVSVVPSPTAVSVLGVWMLSRRRRR